MPELTPEERADQQAREDEIRRGQQAKRLLEDDLFIASMDALIGYYDIQWKNSALGDTEGREAAYRMLRTAAEFRGLLTKIVETGDIAAEQLAVLIAQQEAEDAIEREPI